MSTLDSSRSNRARVAVVLAALVALVALPALAQEAPEPAVAAMSASPGSISWAPRVAHDKLVLTVSGGEITMTREFAGGAPFFAPVDDEGYQLPDGTYNWELTVIPRALDLNSQQFRSDKPSADGRSMRAGTAPVGLVQSGSFTIANGAIVNPGLVEESSARPAPEAAAADIDDSDGAGR